MEKLKPSLSQIQFQGTPGNHPCTLGAVVLVLSEFYLICCNLDHTWLCKKFYRHGSSLATESTPCPHPAISRAQQPAGVHPLGQLPSNPSWQLEKGSCRWTFYLWRLRPHGGPPCCRIFPVAPWGCLFFRGYIFLLHFIWENNFLIVTSLKWFRNKKKMLVARGTVPMKGKINIWWSEQELS